MKGIILDGWMDGCRTLESAKILLVHPKYEIIFVLYILLFFPIRDDSLDFLVTFPCRF